MPTLRHPAPARGEVWIADLDPIRGREQAGRRPVLVISETAFNRGPADLVVIVPITSRKRGIPSHVPLAPPEGGLTFESVALCEAVRSIARDRLTRRLGTASPMTMSAVEDVLRVLMGL